MLVTHTALTNASPPAMLLRGESSDSGGPPGFLGVDSFFDIFFQPTPPVPQMPLDSFFDVFFDIQLPGGGNAPMLPPVLEFTANSFHILIEVHLPGTGGERVVQQHMTGQISPDQPLRFAQVGLGQEQPGLSFFDVFVALEAGGPVDPSQPLLRISTKSTTFTAPVDSFFDVFYTLEPGFPALGTMDILRNSPQGGSFTSTIQVLPRIAFVPVGGGPELVLPGVVPSTVQQAGPHPWRFEPPPSPPPGSGPNFFPSKGVPLQWVATDGTPHTVNPALGPPCPIPFDFNGDLDVDSEDLGVFTSCGTGPSLPYAADSLPPGCLLAADDMGVIAADHDADLDVDTTDFAAFQRCYSGEGAVADPYCACR